MKLRRRRKTRKRQFKDESLQKVYDWFMNTRPDPEEQKSRGSCGNANSLSDLIFQIKKNQEN